MADCNILQLKVFLSSLCLQSQIQTSWLDWRSWKSLNCKQPSAQPRYPLDHQALGNQLTLNCHPLSLAGTSWAAFLITCLSFTETTGIHSLWVNFYLKVFWSSQRHVECPLCYQSHWPLPWQLTENVCHNVLISRCWALTKWSLEYLSTSGALPKPLLDKSRTYG